MKIAIIIFTVVIISISASNVNRTGWDSGWGLSNSAPLPTTSGWSIPTEPPTTGWNPPSIPSGWNAPAPSSNIAIDLTASLAAIGQGWAGSSHTETVSASGDDNTPANVNVISIGDAVVDESASVLQTTQNNSTTGESSNSADIIQNAIGSEFLTANAQGLQANLSQSGWSGASGAGASDVEVNSHIASHANIQGGWGSSLPLLPVIDLGMVSDSSANGEGAADATQDAEISATGSALNSAHIDANQGTLAIVEQEHSQTHLGVVNTNTPSVSSELISQVQNYAQGLDYFNGGGTGIAVNFSNLGSDSASGAGSITNVGSTHNEIQVKKVN